MTKDSLLPELDEAIAFQSRWSDIMSVGHTSMSALIVIPSGTASVVAALGYATEAAILAAVATSRPGCPHREHVFGLTWGIGRP